MLFRSPAGASWPPGTQFEYCPAVGSWVGEALASLAAGAAFYVDYGLPRGALRGPSRPGGTFSVFFRHRQHEDALLYGARDEARHHLDVLLRHHPGDSAALTLLRAIERAPTAPAALRPAP